jgi:hypothetical protein
VHALDTNDGPELQDFRNRRSVSADRLLWAEAFTERVDAAKQREHLVNKVNRFSTSRSVAFALCSAGNCRDA